MAQNEVTVEGIYNWTEAIRKLIISTEVYHKALPWDVGEAYLPMSNIPYPNVGDLSYLKKKPKAFSVLSFKTQQNISSH